MVRRPFKPSAIPKNESNLKLLYVTDKFFNDDIELIGPEFWAPMVLDRMPFRHLVCFNIADAEVQRPDSFYAHIQGSEIQ